MVSPIRENIGRYYYHLTSNDWGSEKLITPKEWSKGRGEWEPRFPRICVCPSIALCLSAFDNGESNLNAYRTKEKVKAIIPWDLSDQKITEEMWIDKPTQFVFISEIPRSIINRINEYDRIGCGFPLCVIFGGAPDDLKEQRRFKKHVINVISESKLPKTKLRNVKWI